MAIIRQDDALSNLPQTLMSILVQKQQIELAKEDQKIRKGDFELRQQEAEAAAMARKGEEEAAMRILEQLGLNQGIAPEAAPAMVAANIQQRQLGLSEREVAAQESNIESLINARTEELELKRQIQEFEEARANTTDAAEQRRIDIALGNLQLGRRELAVRQRQHAGAEATRVWEIGGAEALEAVYGTRSTEEAINSIMDTDNVLDPERYMKSMMAGYGLPVDVQNTVLSGLSEEGVDPQSLVDQLLSDPDIDEEWKARIFASLRELDSNITLSDPSRVGDTFRSTLFKFRVNPFPSLPAPNLTPSAPGSRIGSNAFRG